MFQSIGFLDIIKSLQSPSGSSELKQRCWTWTQRAPDGLVSKRSPVQVISCQGGDSYQFGLLIKSRLLSRCPFCQEGDFCQGGLLQCPGVRMSEAGAQLMAGSASRVWTPVAGPGPGNTIWDSVLRLRLRSGKGKLRQKNGYILQFLHVSFLILGFVLFSRTSVAVPPSPSLLPCFARHSSSDKMWLNNLVLTLTPTTER